MLNEFLQPDENTLLQFGLGPQNMLNDASPQETSSSQNTTPYRESRGNESKIFIMVIEQSDFNISFMQGEVLVLARCADQPIVESIHPHTIAVVI